jgi:signal peptidase I
VSSRSPGSDDPSAPPSAASPPAESHPDAAPLEAVSEPEPEPRKSLLRELPLLIVVAVVLAIVIKTLFVQAFYIPSASMVPTLKVGDRVLVNRLAYRFGDIERGDVIVFSDPHPAPGSDRGVVGGFLHWLGEGMGFARPADEDFIKRVIGLPGEVVEIRDGMTFIDGARIDEPYLTGPKDLRDYGPTTVPDGMLFVMGDNRVNSADSRFPPPAGLGFVPEDDVIGQAFVIVWPPGDWGAPH